MYRTCNPEDFNFKFEPHLLALVHNSTFFCELSRHLTKIPTLDIPTAGVSYDPKYDQIIFYYNPEFFSKLSNIEIRGVITHEFYHLVFGHLAARRKTPHKMWNVATDLAINSIIVNNDKSASVESRAMLPPGCLIPGEWILMPDGRQLSKEEKEGSRLAALIASFPTMKASEWYFSKLMEEAQKSKGKCDKKSGKSGGQPGDDEEGSSGSDLDDLMDSFDDHDVWDNITEEQREYVNAKVKSIVEKSVRAADQSSTGWGSIPADLREEIRKSVSNIINWRQVLRQFIGTCTRGGRTCSIKRINRRYPYVHPGMKRGYVAKLLIARDESGSVSDDMLADFFAELSTLTKKVEIDFLPFDCSADARDIVKWKRGTVPAKATLRTKGGGTDFSAPTEIFNDPKNRGRWDGMLIMTDGLAPEPIPLRGKRGWILAKDCKLMFPSNELQIFVTKDKPMAGAWR